MKKMLPYILIVGVLIFVIGFASLNTFLRPGSVTQYEAVNAPVSTPSTQASAIPVVVPSTDPTSLSLTDTVITTVPGPDVSPLQHQTSFVPQDQIYITVKLSSERVGTELSAKLTYTADQSRLGPVSATVKEKDSAAYAMFELVPPPSGWPKGEYVLSIADPSSSAIRQFPLSMK